MTKMSKRKGFWKIKTKNFNKYKISSDKLKLKKIKMICSVDNQEKQLKFQLIF